MRDANEMRAPLICQRLRGAIGSRLGAVSVVDRRVDQNEIGAFPRYEIVGRFGNVTISSAAFM
jgi:hypothetical protein